MSVEEFKCSICRLNDIDNVNYGEILSKEDISVHLFCLYFSTELPQRADTDEGIVGFELCDIKKLIKKSSKTKCCYCKGRSATTYCNFKGCSGVFHQVCGFKWNGRFEFLCYFRSYCHFHTQIKGIDGYSKKDEKSKCCICKKKIGPYHPVTTIPTCCSKWCHQQCLRHYAKNAPSFLCPGCQKGNYYDLARIHGIYVQEYENIDESNLHNKIISPLSPSSVLNNASRNSRTATNLPAKDDIEILDLTNDDNEDLKDDDIEILSFTSERKKGKRYRCDQSNSKENVLKGRVDKKSLKGHPEKPTKFKRTMLMLMEMIVIHSVCTSKQYYLGKYLV